MLFHLSIEADQPEHVANVFAEIWGGVALPFPPVAKGSWVAFSGADDGSGIEVYPRGTALIAADGDAIGVPSMPHRYNATHFAMSTNLTVEQVEAIAAREGWSAKYCKRGGVFGVIELWVEGCQMVEVLTPEMQREYFDGVSIAGWRAMLAAGPGALAA